MGGLIQSTSTVVNPYPVFSTTVHLQTRVKSSKTNRCFLAITKCVFVLNIEKLERWIAVRPSRTFKHWVSKEKKGGGGNPKSYYAKTVFSSIFFTLKKFKFLVRLKLKLCVAEKAIKSEPQNCCWFNYESEDFLSTKFENCSRRKFRKSFFEPIS